ncbi:MULTISPECIES: DUF721 domain-containing protein [Streptomyces]|uniref:DUF721 domain-containing protein n=1 Tax=Streptomyces TaxID=1883 RepID=UPI0029AC6617|nr:MULTISPECIES: DUF721 domain-containing protein [Streptomyces]MDX3066046.1 DUF721 domain-containing protein [Streptomyces sp. ND04-05B]MDX3519599.1 DUF721 domain-containing protein [Streptomyces scabiei]
MTDTTAPQLSGVDLARVAFLAARESARKNGGATESRTPRPRSRQEGGRQTSDGRDPRGLAAVLQGLITDRAWEAPTIGGSAVDEWPAIAGPRLAGHVRAVKFRAAAGELEVQVDSPAWFTQLRLEKPALLARFAEALGTDVVKDIVRSRPGAAGGDLASERPAARGDNGTRPETRGTTSLRSLVQGAHASRPADRDRADEPSAGTPAVGRPSDPDHAEPDPAELTHALALRRARRERAERKRQETNQQTKGVTRG